MPMVAACGAALALWLCGLIWHAHDEIRRGGGVRGAAVLAAATRSVWASGDACVELCGSSKLKV